MCTHFDILTILAKNQVIEIANFDINCIVQDSNFLLNWLPNFQMFLPENFGSKKQLIIFSELIANYKKIDFGKYSAKNICCPFQKMDNESLSIFLKESLNFFEENGYTLKKEGR